MATHIVNFPDAHVQSTKITATTSVGIGTSGVDAYPLTIFKETEPEIRILEGTTQSSAARLYSNNSNLYIQTGTDFSSGSSGDIAFQTMGGQATHMIVKSDGKVGIGVTNPTYELHMDGNMRIDNGGSITLYRSDTTGGPSLMFRNPDDSTSGWFGFGSSSRNEFRMVTNNNYPLVFYTSATGNGLERMRITPDGNVGIGTNSPAGKFHVSGAGAVYMTISDTSAGTDAKNWWTSVSGNQMTHYLANDASSASQPYMKINRSGYGVSSITFDYGNVGIGVASPTSKLDVSGYIKSTNPCFSAYSIQGNTSYSPAEPIVLEYTLMNVGSCYSTSTGAFTAPVTGYYQFNTVIFNNTGTYRQFTIVWKQSSSSTSWIIPLGNTFINGGTRTGGGDDYLTSDSDSSTKIGSGSILIKLDAGNQIAMCMRSGTNNVSIYRAHSSFSGFLISPA